MSTPNESIPTSIMLGPLPGIKYWWTSSDIAYTTPTPKLINTLKTLFSGHNSLADKIATKANSIANAAAPTSGTYRNNGTYSNTLAELASSKVDEEV